MSLYTDPNDYKVLLVSEYLNFTEIGDTGKTKIIGVGNNSGVKLGLIKWVGAWRKYCFFPACDTFFDGKCLDTIKTFTDELAVQRIIERKKQKDDEDLFRKAYTI
jgi:hypothetical protein